MPTHSRASSARPSRTDIGGGPDGRRRVRTALAATLLLASTLLGVVGPTGTGTPAGAFPGGVVELTGHGYGHARGMGQWGAYGYAKSGWTSNQILLHYYTGVALTPVANESIRVRVDTDDPYDTIVASDPDGAGFTVSSGAEVLAERTADRPYWRAAAVSGGYSVEWAPTQAGPWSAVRTVGGPVDFRPKATSGERRDMLQLLLASGIVWMRGSLTAVKLDQHRTINELPLEDYLRGGVPRESPASWGTSGGQAALEAQAVAARSYTMALRADKRSRTPYPGYDICSTTACQVYIGRAIQDGAGFRDLEAATTDAAVATTAGVLMTYAGAPIVAEYSSSTGGHSATGSKPYLQAVSDVGDLASPYHSWSATVAVSTIEAAYPAVGSLQAIDVTSRNGFGEWGGRVLELVLRGTAGSVTLTGDAFRSKFGLRSNWFLVTASPSGGIGGYWMTASDGGTFAFGNATFFGSMGGKPLNRPVVGMAPSPSGQGYWFVASDGGIFAFGDARFFGSMGGKPLNQPIKGMAPSPSGQGYWFVASDGGIFAFGDAPFLGSMGGKPLNRPVVGMTPSPSGQGYWFVASDGGIFAFGDAKFFGSMGGKPLNQPIVGMASTPTGKGYWLLAADGGLFAFGDGRFFGSLPGIRAPGPAVAIEATTTGGGYLITTSNGSVYAFGDAPSFGGVRSVVPGYRGGVVDMAASKG